MVINYETLNDVFLKAIKGKNKGAVSAVIFDNEKILCSFFDGYINKEQKIAPQDDSLFMIGSNTKVLTALGIFRLIENGVLHLEDPITKYIPDFSVKSRIGEYEVTIENLLMHRAGIQCDLYPYIMGTAHHYTDIVDALKETYRTSIPGTMFSYSNLGYTLLGIVLERASGKTYTEFIQEEVLSPLNMEVYFAREDDLPDTVSSRVARCYDKNGERCTDPLGILVPAGSNTYTTLESLSRVGQLLMNDGLLDGKQIFKPETIRLMKSRKYYDKWDEELPFVGYGIYYRRTPLDYLTGPMMGHGGATVFHHSRFEFLPKEKIGMILFGNFETAQELEGSVETKLFNSLLKEAGFPKKKKEKVSYVKFDPREYTGKYDTAMGPVAFSVTDEQDLTTTFQGMDLSLRLDNKGWLVAKPTTAPSRSRVPIQYKFCQTTYCGQDVLLLETKGTKMPIGERYYDPEINPTWLDAQGTYRFPDDRYHWALEKAELSYKEGCLVATLTIEGVDTQLYLSAVSDTEAVVKGFGRNMKETVFLNNRDGHYEFTVMGVPLVRTED
ncbi:MAG: beta-lactamase family protein [Oscillospiraceae bacterium]|nr:beta-lactamase family protein [Oscillospiraceae bacterium]